MSLHLNNGQMSEQTAKFAQQIGEVILKSVDLGIAMSRLKNGATQELPKEAEVRPAPKSRKCKASKKPVAVTPNQAGPSQLAAPPARKPYLGAAPWCKRCNRHHLNLIPCSKYTYYGRWGHLINICRFAIQNKVAINLAATQLQVNPTQARFPFGACYNCGETGHFRNNCPKIVNGNSTLG
ncbi:putative transcription factor interactor and regulator CCHC(Zn) family [Helianthus annuus]|nr:putative transcription factor interactor and regulator CCHC(Zn) family [Helianthus annuus]